DGSVQPLQVARDDIHFDIHARAGAILVQGGDFERMRNQVDGEFHAIDVVHREAHAIDADGAFASDVTSERCRHFELHANRTRVIDSLGHDGNAIDVAGDVVTTERLTGAQRLFEIELLAGAP